MIHGVPRAHPTGRLGTAIDFPDNHPNGQGCKVYVTVDGYDPAIQRGTIWINALGKPVVFDLDDYELNKSRPGMPPLRMTGTAFVQEV